MPTKQQRRRTILDGTGLGGVYTTTSVSGAANLLVSTAWKSTLYPTTHLDGAYAHVPTLTAPRQRRVTSPGLTLASGTITLDDVFGSTPGSGVEFELCKGIALIDGGTKGLGPSLDQCGDEALRHLTFRDEVTVAAASTADISLTALAGHLDRSDRLVAVLEPSPYSGDELIPADYRGWKLILDGETPKLRFTVRYPTGVSGNLTLVILRPADTWLKTGGGVTWSEVAPGTGMTAEADECKPDLRHLREAGLVFVYQALAESHSGARRAEYQAKYEQQLGIARALPFWDHSRDSLLPRPENAGTVPAKAEAQAA